VDPITLERKLVGVVEGKGSLSWRFPPPDGGHDWLLVLEKGQP
jgi:hypothetical protein